MPQEEHAADEKPIHNLAIVYHGLEGLPETKANLGALVLDGVVNCDNFFLHVDVIAVELADPAKVFDAFFTPASAEEPARGFFEKKRPAEEETSRNELNSKGLNTEYS